MCIHAKPSVCSKVCSWQSPWTARTVAHESKRWECRIWRIMGHKLHERWSRYSCTWLHQSPNGQARTFLILETGWIHPKDRAGQDLQGIFTYSGHLRPLGYVRYRIEKVYHVICGAQCDSNWIVFFPQIAWIIKLPIHVKRPSPSRSWPPVQRLVTPWSFMYSFTATASCKNNVEVFLCVSDRSAEFRTRNLKRSLCGSLLKIHFVCFSSDEGFWSWIIQSSQTKLTTEVMEFFLTQPKKFK